MKLNKFKDYPISIISFILFNFLISYLLIGNVKVIITTTIINIWIFMMPRLTFENSCYQNKMPEWLKKHDIINKIIHIFFPLILLILYSFIVQSKIVFISGKFRIFIIYLPLILGSIQYLILSNSERPMDWITPFIVILLTFIGAEYISGNLSNIIHTIFPTFFNETIVITNLWAILLELLFMYALYQFLSLLIPSRTFSSFLTSFLYIIISMLQIVYKNTFGFSFKINDVLQSTQFTDILKILFLNKDNSLLICQGIAVIAFITIVTSLFNNWSSEYTFKKRSLNFVIGCITLGCCIGSWKLVSQYATKQNLPEIHTQSYQIVSEIKQKNNFDKTTQNKIDQTLKKLGLKKTNKTKPTIIPNTTTPDATIPDTTIPNTTISSNNIEDIEQPESIESTETEKPLNLEVDKSVSKEIENITEPIE